MIKKLQRKFVIIAVCSLFLVELIIIGAINIINVYQLNQNSDNLLHMISDNGGDFPEFFKNKHDNPPHPDYEGGDMNSPDNNGNNNNNVFDKYEGRDKINPETKYVTRYFTVKLDKNGEVSSVDTGHIAAITSDTAIEYAKQAASKNKNSGWTDNYKYKITQVGDESLVVFVDCRSQRETMYQFLMISCSIALAGLLVVSVLITIFSKRAIRPAVESMEKQKQFITDAGHEIKTPLAIISANTEVLELTGGQSEWTDSIKNQTKRLSELIKNLLTLSKIDEEIKTVFEKFDLSNAVYDAAAPFKTLAQTRGKDFDLEVADAINYVGDEGMIRQLVSILMDNAIKYANEGSTIALALRNGQKYIHLTVYNQCSDAPQGDLSKLFDRFYRADSSRARETGGYGIGLSIAHAIVQSHRGKISARSENNGIIFEVLLK